MSATGKRDPVLDFCCDCDECEGFGDVADHEPEEEARRCIRRAYEAGQADRDQWRSLALELGEEAVSQPTDLVCILADHEDLPQPHPDKGDCDVYPRAAVTPCKHLKPVCSLCVECDAEAIRELGL